MRHAPLVVGLLAVLGSAIACGTSEAPKARDEMPSPADEIARGTSDQAMEPVGFRDLQTFFPDLGGWTKEKPTGEKVSMGIKMSRAGVRYVKGDATLDLEITDSSLNQALIAPFAMMLASGYEKESANGFERSATVGGQAGWEKWDNRANDGELNAVVARRFIVKIAGSGVDDLSPLHDLATHADLGRLESLVAR